MIPNFQYQIDPIAALIAIFALIIAALARRDSRRAFRLAETVHKEQGKIKAITLAIIGGEAIRHRGRTYLRRYPNVSQSITENDYTQVKLHSGNDELQIDHVEIIVTLTQGFLFPNVLRLG